MYELIFKNFKSAFYQYFKDDNIIIDNNIVHKIINGTTWEYYEKQFSDKTFKIIDDHTFNERLRNYAHPIKINSTSVSVENIPLKTLLVCDFNEDFKEGECINQLGFVKDFDYFIEEYYFSDISFHSNDHFFVKYILKDVLDEIELSYLNSVFSLLQFYDELFINNCAMRDSKEDQMQNTLILFNTLLVKKFLCIGVVIQILIDLLEKMIMLTCLYYLILPCI